MHLVAEEIETVIYGESDSEEEGEMENLDQCVIEEMLRSPRRNKIRRRSRPAYRSRATDLKNINCYTLFEMTGDDSQKTGRYQQRSISSPLPSSIIYAKKYQSTGEMFMPILLFLGAMFVLLLVVQILTSLLNAVMGVTLILFLVLKLAQELAARPTRLIRNVHSSPVLCMAFVGSVFGAFYAVWQQCLRPLVLFSIHETRTFAINSAKDSMELFMDTSSSYYIASSDYSEITHRIMMWGLLRGLAIGIEVGCIWLIVLGDSSNPTAVSRYIYRRVWQPLKRQYQQTAAVKARRRNSAVRVGVVWENGNAANDDSSSPGYHRNQCAICLDMFQDAMVVAGNGDNCSSNCASTLYHDRYQLLPCLHCFHRECARHWLSIQRTCPVCREKVDGMKGCSPSNY
jgi:hypothetical protein